MNRQQRRSQNGVHDVQEVQAITLNQAELMGFRAAMQQRWLTLKAADEALTQLRIVMEACGLNPELNYAVSDDGSCEPQVTHAK